MDLYHSRLTPDDLNDLIIKYKIPRDLHPRLPLEDFVMSEFSDDDIGIYHRMFDFSSVRIPFSSFLLALIKHYRVHFSQLGPLGLNKVITFEALCRSLHIEPTITVFRVFQTLCKTSGFFFIDRRAILDAMVWRHPDAAIDDPRPAAGSFNMADVHRLSAHVIKLRDMPEVMGLYDFLCLLEWTGAEVQEEPHLDVRSTLQRLPFYGTPPAATDVVIPDPTLEDLAAGTSSSKIVAKAKASQKRKASTSCATSSHILLVTPLRSAAVIPSLGNHGGSFVAPTAEGSNPQDSPGKGVMVDDAAALSAGASRPRLSSGPAPSFRNVSGDAIHMDFFPFSVVPYYATYHDPAICKTIVDQFPTPGEMVRVENLSDDQLTAKMSVLHCMMMSHGGELLTRYHRLNQSYYEYVLSTDSRLKGYEEKVSSLTGPRQKGKDRKKKIKSLTKSVDNLHSEVARLFAAFNQATVLEAEKDEEILRLKTTPPEFSPFFRGQFQGLVWKFLASDKFSRVQGELLSLAASAGFERGLSMHRTKDEFAAGLKKMTNFMPGALDRLAEASPLLVRPANVPVSREVCVSPPPKESTMTPASKSLELSTNDNFTASVVASKHNEEMVNVEVDGSDPKMTDDTATVKSSHAFMQCISVALDNAVKLVAVVGSGLVSSGPNDVVVALSIHEKGDGLDPSFAVGEEAAANPSGV
ncbi:hypothetical protein Tco_1082570 [Tanacetum coccineum]|uniref:Transposase (putative) gypsy type domain-containing protein n=1 Tax=Tanacetum coccineum TaxID=301880 RepID=A0ABQ5I126_9ASTR